jgi:DNA adenine methylase
MRYMGGKSYYKKYLVPILLKGRKPNQYYIEPFVGGANIFAEVPEPKIGADAHYYLIELWKAVADGWVPPKEVSENEFNHIKEFPYLHPAPLVGYVGFTCTMLSKWFGTYVRDHLDNRNGSVINASKSAYRSSLKQFPKLLGCEFIHSEYNKLIIPPQSIIYCDPPYQNTEKYSKGVDHDDFWQWCRDKTEEGHKVFVSEYTAPEDFICVWSKSRLKTSMNHPNKKIKIEKLFVYKGQL